MWASDEHRIGLKPILAKVWAFPGERPLAPVEHRYAWRYLTAFVHPASGRTVWFLLTGVSIELFEAVVVSFARQVGAGPDKEIVLVLDGAGWHTSPRLQVPKHVHLLFLPPYSPELNPAEHLWQLSDTVLVNRHFASIEALEAVQAARCVTLSARRDLVRSTACFAWWPQRLRKLQPPNSS